MGECLLLAIRVGALCKSVTLEPSEVRFLSLPLGLTLTLNQKEERVASQALPYWMCL